MDLSRESAMRLTKVRPLHPYKFQISGKVRATVRFTPESGHRQTFLYCGALHLQVLSRTPGE